MKNVKKLLAFLIAVVMTAAVFTGIAAAPVEGVIYYDTFDNAENGYVSSVETAIIPGTKDTVIEYRAKSLTEEAVSGGVKITCDDIDEFEITSDTYTGEWAVYNILVSSSGSAASYYKDGTFIKTVEFNGITLADTYSVVADFISNGNIAFDYAAIYEKPSAIDVTAENYADGVLEISINIPVAAALSEVSLGDAKGVFAKKEGSAFEYTAAFDASAIADGDNTAVFTLRGFDGELLDEAEITFSAKPYELPEYVNRVPYLFDNFNSASELEHYKFNDEGGACTLSVDEAAGQMNIASSAVNDSKFPSIFYNEIIPNTENFVLEYKVDNLGSYCAVNISLGQDNSSAAGIFSITRNDALGAFKIYFDFAGEKAYLYKEGTLMKTAAISNKPVTQIKITLQNYKNSITKIDYIYAYPVADEFSMKAEKITADSMVLKTTEPISTDESTFAVNGAAAQISAAAGEYCAYNIVFGQPLEYLTSYKLTCTVMSLGGAQLIKNYGLAFETGAYEMPEYAEALPYIFDNFNSASELEHYKFNDEGGACTLSADEAAGQANITCSENGSKFPSIFYNGTIPNTSNFVFEYKIDDLGSYCPVNINMTINSTSYNVGKNGHGGFGGATARGSFKVYVDFKAGKAYFYQDNTLKNTADIPNGAVTEIKIGAQNYNKSTTKIDYIYAYPVTDEFSMKTQDAEVRSIALKTTEPINTDESTFAVNGTAAQIAAAKDEYCTYKIIFGEKLLYSTQYTLTSNIKTLKGVVAVKNYETVFTTPEYTAPQYSAPEELLFENFEDGTFDSNVFRVSDSSSQKMELIDGKLRVVGTTNPYPRLSAADIPADADNIVIEYNMSSVGYNNTTRFGIVTNSGEAMSSYIHSHDFTDTRYVLYNPVAGTFDEYNGNFEKIGSAENVSKAPTSFSLRYYLYSNNFAEKYFEWDYVAVYKQAEDFTMKLENVTENGAVLKTSIPLNTAETLFNVGGTAVTAVKNGNSYNTYTLAFEKPLAYNTDYVLSGNASYLGGVQSVAVNEAFKTGAAPYEYSNLTAVTGDEGVKAQITVSNNTETALTFVLVAAVYENGALQGVKATQVTAEAGVKDAVLTSEAVPVQVQTPVYKVFAWENMDNIAPLTVK